MPLFQRLPAKRRDEARKASERNRDLGESQKRFRVRHPQGLLRCELRLCEGTDQKPDKAQDDESPADPVNVALQYRLHSRPTANA